MKGERAKSFFPVGTQEIIHKTKISRNSIICRFFKDLGVNFHPKNQLQVLKVIASGVGQMRVRTAVFITSHAEQAVCHFTLCTFDTKKIS